MSCSIPSCRRREREDSADEDDGDQVRRMSGDQAAEGANEIVQREHRPRLHKLSVFDPPPSRFTLLRGKIWKSIKTLYAYWLRLRNDRYQWALFKAILWFAIGLKLFHDLARHAKVSPLFGGGQSNCPKITRKARHIDPCAKPTQIGPCGKPPQIGRCNKSYQSCAYIQSDESPQTPQSEEDKKIAEQCCGRLLYKI